MKHRVVSECDRGGGVALWAGRLLGGALVLVLAAGALILSPDGARLRRLAGGRTGAGSLAPVRGTDRESPPSAVEASATGGPSTPALRGNEPAAAEPPPSGALACCGWIAAEAIGPSDGVGVYLDGALKGAAPVVIGGIECGVHTLRFAASEGLGWDEKVRVTAGDTTVVACAAPGGAGLGRILIQPAERRGRAQGGEDTVLVDGLLAGAGELSVEVSPGYHSVSFVGGRPERRDIVLHVPPGSVQYVSSPEIDPPFSIVGTPAKVEGDLVFFEARTSKRADVPSELSLVIIGGDGGSTRTASMPQRSPDGAYAGALPTRALPKADAVRYFFRAVLGSGAEIDSPVYTIERRSR